MEHDWNAGFGIRYSYSISDAWSIGLGADYQKYGATARFDNVSGAYATTDVEGESFEFRYSALGFKEKQNLQYANIPLTVQFETTDDDEVRFYISGGVKAGIVIKSEYETSMANLSTSGYYPQYNGELFGPTFMGFGQFSEVRGGKQELDTKLAWSGTLETGFKQAFGKNGWAYLGLFVDYSFSSIYDKGNRELVEYPQSAPVALKYNSVLDTNKTGDPKLLAFGFKFRLAIR